MVRAYIEHQLGETGQLQKLYYIGPQFRRERPQKGRYRQFFQIGAEVIGPPSAGSESPLRDAEVLEMLATLLSELGITGWKLLLNSVGSATDRPRYVQTLRAALEPVVARMCEDCQRRAVTNPLRVLDCKHPEDQPIIATLPRIWDSLDEGLQGTFCRRLHRTRRLWSALRARPSPGARPRLLHPDDVRVRLRRPGGAPERPARRRPLRRALGGHRRPQGAGHRICHGRRSPGAGCSRHRAGIHRSWQQPTLRRWATG